MRRQLATALLLLSFPLMAFADSFVVEDIRFDGLQRMQLGRVLSIFPIQEGDQVDEFSLAKATRALFSSGYFNDVQLARDGNLLIVRLTERPAISRITIEGNKEVKTEGLKEGLAGLGLVEGEVFQRAALDKIRLELLQVYAAQGRYGAQIETSVEPLPENRLGLNINIKEGKAAAVQHINVVGNEVFSDEELIDLFSLKTPGFWDFFSEGRYSREKLSGDLERLRSYYLDKGYINFKIDSTQVSLTPDRKHVFVTVNITEGDLYFFGDYDLAGKLEVAEDQLLSQVAITPGETFSRDLMVRSADKISRRLGDDGFLLANVKPVPTIDEQNKTVSVRFYVEPGNRMYVRRINFVGNTSTADEVLRREMRQMEAAWASTNAMEKSKDRLERLGFFSEVNVETTTVPGVPDQIDLEYSVVEQLSGSLSASIGVSQSSGLILGASVSQKNFLGSGNFVSFNVTRSDNTRELSFSYENPYYTVDGVSRGFSAYYREEDLDDDDLSDYNLDSYGGAMSFGYPIDEHQRLGLSIGAEQLNLKLGSDVPNELNLFVQDEGDSFTQLPVVGSWSSNHLNRGLLPTEGYSQRVSLEVAGPGSDLNFYKLRYFGQLYYPLSDDQRWVVRGKTNLGYGDAFGDTTKLPFFKTFRAGGFESVRGFKNNTLGPRDARTTSGTLDPLGGNVLITGSAELIFPVPFIKDQSNMRTLLFWDVGGVFDRNCLTDNPACDLDMSFSNLSSSVGVGLSWLTFIGPMSFSLGVPVKEQEHDEDEFFQFSLGKTF
ncbi:outer membrane protein assembly factor BamA [Motiliproteus coralliicola]|uniref:Outer membrane protein assembly factor BamA n=1 Tax=Motiliproteus coralliicola TaxID=2283196 RepID=A0A369WBG8_9GAMM|nr:outer membrane protein assembly factor BamA [Motiliproteus coralliicola]RDE18519.1 outer membrane protein assembly factor BamA [Motiliproteus coralliicola]